LPCTVAKVTPRLPSPRTAARTVSGNIEKLQVDEDLVSPSRKPVDQAEEPVGHEQFQADLVKTHAVSEALH